MANTTLQDIFNAGFDSVQSSRALHPRESTAARCIMQCFTPALGAHLQLCPNGDFEHIQFHACRHRACPRCAERSRATWVDSELQRLLPCPHFHVVFTLPHCLLPLWERNRAWFIHTLFDCARASLLQMLADPRHLGATPGLSMSLHTWGRNLSHHPHVHCLLSAGGLSPDGQWLHSKPGWLLPVRPLQHLWRGKLLHALWQALARQQLQLPAWTTASHWRSQIRALYRSHFNVEIRPPYEHGRGVALYLARYAKGGPLPADRALRLHGNQVLFDYTDHRTRTSRTLCLPIEQFIERILWHAPPKGVHTTRHAGLYSSARREHHALAQARLLAQAQLLTASPPWPRSSNHSPPSPASPPSASSTSPKRCPHCGGPLLRLLLLRPAPTRRLNACSAGQISLPPPAISTGPPPARSNSPPPTAVQRGPTMSSSGRPTAGPSRQTDLSSASRGRLSAAA